MTTTEKINKKMIIEDDLLHVTHINSYFITSPVHSELIAALDKAGLRQQVFVPVNKASQKNMYLPHGMEHSTFHYNKCFGLFDRYLWPLKIFKIWRAFKRHYKENPSRIIHAHTLIVNGLIAYLAHRKWGTPFLVTVRFSDVHIFMNSSFVFKKIGLKIMKKAMAVVFISPSYLNYQICNIFKEEEVKIIKGKSHLIPNGINDFWLNNRQSKVFNQGVERGKRIMTIIFAGSLSSRKNPLMVLRACETLCHEGFAVKLLIAGSGPLLRQIKKHRGKTEVICLGYLANKEDMAYQFRRADILIVPSIMETFGLVYPEAMSQALPVVYSRNEGFDGFFPDGEVGYAVFPDSPSDIAAKIRDVYANYEFLSNNAHHSVSVFSWKALAVQWLSLYNTMKGK